MRIRIADLFSGGGGAGFGLHQACAQAEIDYQIVGYDINPQPNYPAYHDAEYAARFEFHQADALEVDLSGFDAVWASPPCQAYSIGAARWRNAGYEYPDLIGPTRERIKHLPYIMENVVGARKQLIEPITLCGQTFGIGVVRHRLFEMNWFCLQPKHVSCVGAVSRDAVSVTGHGPPGRWYRAVTVAGHGGNSRTFKLDDWKDAMEIDWMKRDELTQAIPPAHSHYLGTQLIQQMTAA